MRAAPPTVFIRFLLCSLSGRAEQLGGEVVAEQRHLATRELRGGAGCLADQTKGTEVVGRSVIEVQKRKEGRRRVTTDTNPSGFTLCDIFQEVTWLRLNLQVARIQWMGISASHQLLPPATHAATISAWANASLPSST